MSDIRNIAILTGAGISAESGIAIFCGPDGLREGHRVEDEWSSYNRSSSRPTAEHCATPGNMKS